SPTTTLLPSTTLFRSPAMLTAQTPFLYVRAPGDSETVVDFLGNSGACATREDIGGVQLWHCNHAGTPVATFDGGLELVAAHLPRSEEHTSELQSREKL